MKWLNKFLHPKPRFYIYKFKFEKSAYVVPQDISKIDKFMDFEVFFKNRYGNEIIYFCKHSDTRFYIEFTNKKGELIKDYIIAYSTSETNTISPSNELLEILK